MITIITTLNWLLNKIEIKECETWQYFNPIK